VKFTFIIFVLLLISEYTYSQLPTIDPSFRDILIYGKNDYFQKMIYKTNQKTTNQEEFDISYYFLDLIPDPETSVLSGTVEIVAKVTGIDLDHIELDFWSGMNILDIHMTYNPGEMLYYTHMGDILYISLDKVYMPDEEIRVSIKYIGQPQNSPYNSFDFGIKDNKPMIWTLSQPFGARAWWPCKDVTSDKADSVDIKVTVPNDLIVASNGILREKVTSGEKTTYWWHEKYPIIPYLISLAIHPYIVSYDDYLYNENSDTMKIHFYMFPENADLFSEMNAKTKDIIRYFSELFGQYPFVDEKYAHADFLGKGAMEHQTCSSFSFWNEWVIVHELAHQWWGDFITCDNFHHIWLNEGFATYSEALWYEHLHGYGTASHYQMTTNLYLGAGTVYVEDPQNEDIFNPGLSYNKSSWILHMLRHIVGDESFFNILKTYSASQLHKFGTANTEDFQRICEQVSGINLDKFFHQWIYEEYYPRYSVRWKWIQNGGMYQIQLDIKQVQENHYFWMPIDISISTIEGEFSFVVWDSLSMQTFTLEVPSEPLSLEIDKNNWILKQVESDISQRTEIADIHPLKKYALYNNYPNPFNPITAIGYQLSAVSKVDLSIYNLLGQRVETLVSEKQNAGQYRVEWDGSHFPSGIYYYQIKAGHFEDIKKMILLK